MTNMTAAEPRGDCPNFNAFLDRIMSGDKALIAYLQRVFGYCLSNDTDMTTTQSFQARDPAWSSARSAA